jgi:hypothetical protein
MKCPVDGNGTSDEKIKSYLVAWQSYAQRKKGV